MLFNSYVFIFAFLPLSFLGYFLLARWRGGESAMTFLVLASLFFYGWWNPIYLVLILASMGVNYFVGESITRDRAAGTMGKAKTLLILGITFNLGLLGYFKYGNFFVDNVASLTGSDFHLDTIILPLAISFFTFQQIAYLVDAYKGITEEFKFIHYALFVTFFPQLIAGPIVHHKEMLPQFMRMENLKPQLENVVIGLTIFSLGLFKKVVIADSVAPYSTGVFTAAANGDVLTFFQAWGGALAYTFQLYFDFSGYSDMAIGIARMFGIRLPLNFASPYKALNIVEFWRRWHITLSRFLRDYVYIALGGNRHGNTRRYVNLMTTMLLGGLWHGAGWAFVLWGGLHGAYLVINHAWHYLKRSMGLMWLDKNRVWRAFAWLLTFISVVNAWVFFRAEDMDVALAVLQGMYGFNGIALPNGIVTRIPGLGEMLASLGVGVYLGGGSQFLHTYLWIGVLLPAALLLPNTQQIMRRFTYSGEPAPDHAIFDQGILQQVFSFRYSTAWSWMMAATFVLALFGLSRVSEFLYFQF